MKITIETEADISSVTINFEYGKVSSVNKSGSSLGTGPAKRDDEERYSPSSTSDARDKILSSSYDKPKISQGAGAKPRELHIPDPVEFDGDSGEGMVNDII